MTTKKTVQRASPLLRDGKNHAQHPDLMASGNGLAARRFIPQWLPTAELFGDGSGAIVRRPRGISPRLFGEGSGPLVKQPGGIPPHLFGRGNPSSEPPEMRGVGCIPDTSDRRDSCHDCLQHKLQPVTHPMVQLPAAPKKGQTWLTLKPKELKTKLTQPRLHLGDGNDFLGPVRDQGPWNSCTAQAAATALAFRLRLMTGQKVPELSTLFVYRASRYLLGLTGDTGSDMRSTFKALAKLGTPSESTWPYNPEELLDEMPDAFVCQMAQEFSAGSYFRLDAPAISGTELVLRLKSALADGLPICFGLPAHESLSECCVENGFVIPLPEKQTSSDDRLVGGHAMLMVGFDDDAVWKDDHKKNQKGAFIVRNSWGDIWGDLGYAFLPYPFVSEGLTLDPWVTLPK